MTALDAMSVRDKATLSPWLLYVRRKIKRAADRAQASVVIELNKIPNPNLCQVMNDLRDEGYTVVCFQMENPWWQGGFKDMLFINWSQPTQLTKINSALRRIQATTSMRSRIWKCLRNLIGY